MVGMEMKITLRAILYEFSYPLKFWVFEMLIVQATLNNLELKWMGKRTSVPAFTGHPGQSGLKVIKLKWQPEH